MDLYFRIELFGQLQVVHDGKIHARFRTHKAAHLLAYMALHCRQAQPREHLLEIFWPDKESAAARNGLSTALAQLRRQFERSGTSLDGILLADRQQVRLNTDLVTSDVADFERLLRLSKTADDRLQQIDLLEQAIALYRGELLPGCCEEWALASQTHYQSLYIEGLRRLIHLLEETERYSDALPFTQRALSADPYAEDIARIRMQLLVRAKQPSLALQTYERLEQLFLRDLGAAPSLLTRRMAEMIRQDPRAAALLHTEQSLSPPAPAAAPPASTPEPPSSPLLPMQLTRFFGRLAERRQLADLLQTPDVRLISILGPGGAGKTRLALEVAGQMAAHFENRVWFASLADIPDAGLILSTLVQTLRLPPGESTDLLEKLAAFLGKAPCLLVLDNLEHLLGKEGRGDYPVLQSCSALIRLLLAHAPGLVCLVTSRQALRLGGEQEFYLPPLQLPAESESGSLETLKSNECVALYLDRARMARLDFALTRQNAASVIELCRRLEGMPLALEMAAAWTKTFPPQKMLERLEPQLDLLVSRRRDLPPRHQSLRATIEWSYDLLSPELREMFMRLSVFRGGWTAEAAEAVCGGQALHALRELQEYSLIVEEETDEEPRYRMLETLRQHGSEKLHAAGETALRCTAHRDFFWSFLTEAGIGIHGPEQAVWLKRIERDQANLRSALDWCAQEQTTAAPGSPEERGPRIRQWLQMVTVLERFWEVRGLLTEGRTCLESALAFRREAHPPCRTKALTAAGLLAWKDGDCTAAERYHQESLELNRELNDQGAIARSLNNLAVVADGQGDYDKMQRYLEESLEIYRALNQPIYIGAALSNLGVVTSKKGQFDAAQSYYEESLLFLRPSGMKLFLATLLHNLGDVMLRQRLVAQAIPYLQESVQIRTELGDALGLICSLERLATVAVQQSRFETAARRLGTAEAALKQACASRGISDARDFARDLGEVRSHLPPSAFHTAWEQGMLESLPQALAEAFAP